MRAPFKGCSVAYFSLVCIRPGISFSASSISRRPKAARLMSATLYFAAGALIFADSFTVLFVWVVMRETSAEVDVDECFDGDIFDFRVPTGPCMTNFFDCKNGTLPGSGTALGIMVVYLTCIQLHAYQTSRNHETHLIECGRCNDTCSEPSSLRIASGENHKLRNISCEDCAEFKIPLPYSVKGHGSMGYSTLRAS